VTRPQRQIVAVDAFVLAARKDYPGGAGLETPASANVAKPRLRALEEVGDLHICAYPPQAQTCLVRITADDGTVGWGEAHAPLGPAATKAVVEDVLAPIVLGKDPLAIERHWEYMYGSQRLRGHVTGYQMEAISGVDIALWDLAGKLLDVPVYTLLGGPLRTELPCYASGVPGKTPEERFASAERFVDEGFTGVKASIGRGNVVEDLAGVQAVVDAVAGRADVLVDAHGAYASDLALQVGRKLEAMGVTWLEDALPPEDIAGYVRLSGALDMLVVGGETECTRWQVQERLAAGAFDVILPDVCRAGGISEGRKIADVARLYNVRWAAHVSMGSSVHVAAAAHLAAASPNFLIYEFSSTPNPLGDGLLTAPLNPEGGMLQVPDGPGLGIEFDLVKLAEYLEPGALEGGA
jgi:L-alanine-DL-glutamate epimerase-like enolase superfamily enzyme